MSIIPIINLGSGKVDRKKYLIKDGVLQDGVAFVSNINNFGGSTVSGYYRYTRQSGSGNAIGRTTSAFDFSGGKKLYIEGYTSGVNSNCGATNASASITVVDNLTNRHTLETTESTVVFTPATNNEYIYLYSFSSTYYGFVKNMWIE